MKLSSKLALSVCGLAVALSAPSALAASADIIFVVDESGSMAGEHAWLAGMVTQLNTALVARGVTGNQFGLVGFGGGGAGNGGHQINVGGGAFGTAAQLATATANLVTSGSTEDGYSAISFAHNNYALRSGAAHNVILITDEDRDNTNNALTFANIRALLGGDNSILNVVVDANAVLAGNTPGIGVAAQSGGGPGRVGYQANGSGGFTRTNQANNLGSFNGEGNTDADYVQLAYLTGGAFWDLNILRSGGVNAQSFTAAFVDHKVQEIQIQVPLPVTGAMGMAGLSLIALRRRRALA